MDRQTVEQDKPLPWWVILPLAALAAGLVLAILGLPRPARTDPRPPSPALLQGQRLNEIPFPVSALLSRQDILWVGSDTAGLFALREGELATVVPNVLVYSLLPDGENLFVGYGLLPGEPVTETTQGGGRAVFDRPVFIPGDDQPGEAGLAHWDGGQFSPLWDQEAVWGLARAEDGRLFLSTNHGLYEYLPQRGKARRLGLADRLCFGLLYDEETRALYVSARGGIYRYASSGRYAAGQWSHVLDLGEDKALDLIHPAAGRFYAATTAGLFFSSDGLAWTRPGPPVALESLALAGQRVLAGGEGGLYEYDEREGLRLLFESGYVHALAWRDGLLYAGTDDGLWAIKIQEGGKPE